MYSHIYYMYTFALELVMGSVYCGSVIFVMINNITYTTLHCVTFFLLISLFFKITCLICIKVSDISTYKWHKAMLLQRSISLLSNKLVWTILGCSAFSNNNRFLLNFPFLLINTPTLTLYKNNYSSVVLHVQYLYTYRCTL